MAFLKLARLLAGLAAICAVSLATAETWPDKPIRMITPFTSGGATGVLGRVIGEKLTGVWGEGVVVEGRPSAGGIVATQAVASAQPDGYTILLATANVAIAPSLYKSLPYDPKTALLPLTEIITVPNVIVARPELPVKSIADVVALAKAQPGKLTYASPGSGSFPHLTMELLKKQTGTDILHVPYKGSPAALVALVGGEVDLFSSNYLDVAGLIQAGKLRALAVTSPKRLAALPDVPTVAESGVPGFDAVGWMGFFAPQKTPPAIADKLSRQIAAVVKEPAMSAWLHSQGFEAVGSSQQEFASYLASETLKWAEVVKFSGVKPE